MGKVYVVGHQGFIGRNVVEQLGKNELSFITKEDFKKIIHNELKLVFNPDDILINLAWDHLDNFQSPLHISETLIAHMQFYDNVLKMGLQHITAVGTCVEYGMREGELNESMLSDPILPYAIAKDSLRKYLEFKMLQNKFNFNWVRIFFLFGKDQPSKSIYGQLVRAVEEKDKIFNMSLGQQQRDYLTVVEVASIITRIALKRGSFGVINCCSGKPIKVVDFVKQRLDELGWSMQLNLGKYDYPKYEAFEFWGNANKLNQILDS